MPMRWAIITGMYNVADLATEFCRYHLSLGVDKIFVADYGSDDGTVNLLSPFVREGHVQVVPLSTHRFADYDPSNAILALIRKKDAADWVSFLDPDEFLAGPENLKTSLTVEWSRGIEAISLPRFNLTGVGPIPPQAHYLTHLTLKIVTTDVRVSSASAPLSSPWIFSRIPPKVMIRAQSSLTTTTGDHHVVGADQALIRSSPFEILHLPMRGYEAFQEKIERGMDYLALNPELGSGTGWHWRRWIDLFQSGRLREEYQSQFLEAPGAELLLAQNRIVPEMRLADWWTNGQTRER
jgi:hypothetical protein